MQNIQGTVNVKIKVKKNLSSNFQTYDTFAKQY